MARLSPEENDDAMQDLQFIGPLNSYITNNTSSLTCPNLYNQQEILQLFAQLQQNEENDELKKIMKIYKRFRNNLLKKLI